MRVGAEVRGVIESSSKRKGTSPETRRSLHLPRRSSRTLEDGPPRSSRNGRRPELGGAYASMQARRNVGRRGVNREHLDAFDARFPLNVTDVAHHLARN